MSNATKKTLPLDPEEQNSDRSQWARVAIRAYQIETGTDDQDAISDLINDLAHFCDRHPEYETVGEAIRRARNSYSDETKNTGRQFDEDYDGIGPCVDCGTQCKGADDGASVLCPKCD